MVVPRIIHTGLCRGCDAMLADPPLESQLASTLHVAGLWLLAIVHICGLVLLLLITCRRDAAPNGDGALDHENGVVKAEEGFSIQALSPRRGGYDQFRNLFSTSHGGTPATTAPRGLDDPETACEAEQGHAYSTKSSSPSKHGYNQFENEAMQADEPMDFMAAPSQPKALSMAWKGQSRACSCRCGTTSIAIILSCVALDVWCVPGLARIQIRVGLSSEKPIAVLRACVIQHMPSSPASSLCVQLPVRLCSAGFCMATSPRSPRS